MSTVRLLFLLVLVPLLGLAACSSDGGSDSGAGERSRAADASGAERALGDLYYLGDGRCPTGASGACMSPSGTPAYKWCEYGRWSACVYECEPGSSKKCTGGTQACDHGRWGACQ